MQQTVRYSSRYQTLLVLLLSLNFGIVFFDRNSLNFLMPFVQPDLELSNSQIGFVAGIFSFVWAIAALGVGRVSDIIGNRKALLVIASIAFSACSFLTGLASTFAMLVGARIVMGLAEGGIMPISHAIITSEVEPKARGLAQGVAQNFGSNFLGSFVAPVVLVWLAEEYGWRNAFYLAGVPGLISAAILWFVLKEPEAAPRPTSSGKSLGQALREWLEAVVEALKVRNVRICVGMGIVLVAYLVITWAFMPLYLTKEAGFTDTEASWLMATLGISATICSFIISGLSDYFGRRPIMIIAPFVSLLLPLGAMYYHGPYIGMVAIFFFGWALNGAFPLFMATVPSESVPPHMMATVFGLAMGVCEIVGGAGGPALAGVLADAYGLTAPLWMLAILTLAGGLMALGVTETAPRVLAKRAA